MEYINKDRQIAQKNQNDKAITSSDKNKHLAIQKFGNKGLAQLMKDNIEKSKPTKQFRDIIQKYKGPDNPNNEWEDYKTDGGKAHEAEIQITTKGHDGGAPSVSPIGWTWLQGNFGRLKGNWVRFHLINQFLGGPGNDVKNLIPTTVAINHSPKWRHFEEDTKAKNKNNDPIHAYVRADYPNGANPDGFPNSISFESSYFDSMSDDWETITNHDKITLSQPSSGQTNELYPHELSSSNWEAIGFNKVVAQFLASVNINDATPAALVELCQNEFYINRTNSGHILDDCDVEDLIIKNNKKKSGIKLRFDVWDLD